MDFNFNRTVWLIDSENVNDNWVGAVADASQRDQIVIFYTDNSANMSVESVSQLAAVNRQMTWKKCFTGTNALDFQLVSELGSMIAKRPKDHYVIVANDTGYDAVVKYWSNNGIKVERVGVENGSPKKSHRHRAGKRLKAKTIKKLEMKTVDSADKLLADHKRKPVAEKLSEDFLQKPVKDDSRDLKKKSESKQKTGAGSEVKSDKPLKSEKETDGRPQPGQKSEKKSKGQKQQPEENKSDQKKQSSEKNHTKKKHAEKKVEAEKEHKEHNKKHKSEKEKTDQTLQKDDLKEKTGKKHKKDKKEKQKQEAEKTLAVKTEKKANKKSDQSPKAEHASKQQKKSPKSAKADQATPKKQPLAYDEAIFESHRDFIDALTVSLSTAHMDDFHRTLIHVCGEPVGSMLYRRIIHDNSFKEEGAKRYSNDRSRRIDNFIEAVLKESGYSTKDRGAIRALLAQGSADDYAALFDDFVATFGDEKGRKYYALFKTFMHMVQGM